MTPVRTNNPCESCARPATQTVEIWHRQRDEQTIVLCEAHAHDWLATWLARQDHYEEIYMYDGVPAKELWKPFADAVAARRAVVEAAARVRSAEQVGRPHPFDDPASHISPPRGWPGQAPG